MSDISLSEDSGSMSDSSVSSEYSSEVEDLEEEGQASADSYRPGSQVGLNQNGACAVEPYADEPIASAEWLQNYREQQQEEHELLERLKRCLDGDVASDMWCSCGNCQIQHLENAKECMCCTEILECGEALKDKWVVEEIGENTPTCIIELPGLKIVCLQRWSLKLAADKYKTLQNKKYTQIGAEEQYGAKQDT